MQTFVALRNVNFRYLWVSSAFISAGNQVQQIAMGALAWDLTASPFWVGTILGIRALPILLIGPLAGVAVDRIDRKKLFLGAQLALVVIAFLFGLDVLTGNVNVWHMLVFSFLLGLDSSLNQPVRQALIVNTVPKEDLTNAIALNNVASSVMQSIGPLVSAGLIAWLAIAGNFFIQSAAYLIVFFILLPLKTPYREAVVMDTSVMRNFFDGLRYLKQDRTLLLLVLLVFVPSLFVHSVQFQFSSIAGILFSDEGMPFAWRLGLLGASLGVGALFATAFVASLGNFRRGKINLIAALMVAVFLVLFGLSTNIYLSFVLIGCVGFCNTIFRLANNALVQSRTPDEFRGRITSIYVLDHGFQPLGSPGFGALAEDSVLGLQRAIVVFALVALLVTSYISLKYRQLWRLE